jgi:hypothetical protein
MPRYKMSNMTPDTTAVWRLTSVGPWPRRLRLRLGLLLYLVGARRLAVHVAGTQV